ncbi:MAG: arginine--tRNA ligase [Flavobacterium sp.]|nr:arginine--tRNA ligase [Flavobacterium sp.]
MNPEFLLKESIAKGLQKEFSISISAEEILLEPTRKDFEGSLTFVVFPFIKQAKISPEQLGTKIGAFCQEGIPNIIASFNVVKGFLNIVFKDSIWVEQLYSEFLQPDFGKLKDGKGEKVMVEYSSPNTNKPLHLGHLRNNFLGYSISKILEANGFDVIKANLVNDRGIHICKSMIAYQKFSNQETPSSAGIKGDHLVGKYYVEFDQIYKKQITALIASGKSEDDAKKQAPFIVEAQQMLLDWESGKPEVMQLWRTMNQWVYDGFDTTYKNLGVDFDSKYYESNTYLLGKDVVQMGLEKGIFEKDADGSVWIDLTPDGLDRKIVLRSDGTAVYMTQDIGTAIQRVKDYPDVGGMVYTVGNEQDYHFKVLFLILKKLGFDWSANLYHLSYGMVELPTGKMKSREGTVVDADDLMEEMTQTAKKLSEDLGKLEGFADEEKSKLYNTIGLGALKYYMLKVDPKKSMLFNPEESVDFAGNTGPFIQYTYARIQSILRKANFDFSNNIELKELHLKEKELIKQILMYPEVIQSAANNYSPALMANYTYDLVKEYNSFYQSVSILGEENFDKKSFRVQLSCQVSETIKSSFKLLGIDVPDRM